MCWKSGAQRILHVSTALWISVGAHARSWDWTSSPKLQDFRSKQHVSIGFAAQNMSNPASLFGHTFLVAHDDDFPEPDSVVLEYLGRTDGVLLAPIRALVATIPGIYRFSSMLGKSKDFENDNRDVWLYRLRFTSLQRGVLNQLVEDRISQASGYNFPRRNCAFEILDLVVSAYGTRLNWSPVTIPRQTIAILKAKGFTLGEPFRIVSTQEISYQETNLLNEDDLVNLHQVLGGYTVADDRLARVAVAASAVVDHRGPRESDEAKRNRLYLIKRFLTNRGLRSPPRVLRGPAAGLTPDQTIGDTSFRVGARVSARGTFIEGRLAGRDFFTGHRDSQRASYVEILRANLSIEPSRFFLREITLFRMDSLTGSQDWYRAFNRYVDVGYSDLSAVSRKEFAESFLRYGRGISFSNSNLTLGATPYVGLSHQLPRLGGQVWFDVGVRFRLNHWVTDRFRFELVTTYRPLIQTAPEILTEGLVAYNVTPNWTVGVRGQASDRFNHGEVLAAYSY